MKPTTPSHLPESTPVLLSRISIFMDRGNVVERLDEYTGKETAQYYVLEYHRSTDPRRKNNAREFEREFKARHLKKGEVGEVIMRRDTVTNEANFGMWCKPGEEAAAREAIAAKVQEFFDKWELDIAKLNASVCAQRVKMMETFGT